MNNLALVNAIEADYWTAVGLLNEITNLVPTFKILGHSYAYSSLHAERRYCDTIRRSIAYPVTKEAMDMLAKVPHAADEIVNISSMIYLDKNKVNIVTEKHLKNCQILMAARLERVKMMQEAYY